MNKQKSESNKKLIALAITIVIHVLIFYSPLTTTSFFISDAFKKGELTVKVSLNQQKQKKSVPLKREKKKVIDKSEVKKVVEEKTNEVKETTKARAIEQSASFESSILNYVEPDYPRVAIRRGITGVVVLELKVNHLGTVVEVLLAQSSGKEILDESALSASKQWKFKENLTREGQLLSISKRIVYKIN
ncbi:MAG: energy transducer TonB [Oligoflexia bacterium]|nr:energy transducer TonB [Oligoflexia bacterium]